jgi:hypothetical protein
MEECALSMGQRRNSNDAAVKDAQVLLGREECAGSMVQSANYATVKDAPIKLRREECVLSMGQSANDAAAQDVKIKLSEEEYVEDTEHTATPMMNLQLLHHVLWVRI